MIIKKKKIFLMVLVIVLTINLVYVLEGFSTGRSGFSGPSRLEDRNITSSNNSSNMTNTTIAANTG